MELRERFKKETGENIEVVERCSLPSVQYTNPKYVEWLEKQQRNDLSPIKATILYELSLLNKEFDNENVEGIALVKIATRRKAYSDMLKIIGYTKTK